jgi:hypothetical protein
MKKLILLLQLLPIISFGQIINDISSSTKENPWVFEQGDNKTETYLGLYNNIESAIKVIHYHKGKKNVEVSFKGFNYKTYDIKHSDGKIRKVTSQEKIRDGFSREWNDKGEPCSERFYIYGKCIYEGEDCNNLWINPIGYGDGDSYNSSREFDLEFMINTFLDDIINNNLERGEPSNSIKKIRIQRKSPINGIKIKAIFTTLDKDVLALSSGFKDENNIILKVDPENWLKASSVKKWYTLYHELGHDVLNFEHGQGGRMMFNYSLDVNTWSEFNEDRDYMFNVFLKNKI